MSTFLAKTLDAIWVYPDYREASEQFLYKTTCKLIERDNFLLPFTQIVLDTEYFAYWLWAQILSFVWQLQWSTHKVVVYTPDRPLCSGVYIASAHFLYPIFSYSWDGVPNILACIIISATSEIVKAFFP